jgi:hypothetical protein
MTDKPIDKIEAAGRQLDGACRLRLDKGDSLIVHTLGFAAFGILSDLVRHREHPMNDVLDILRDRASKMWREFRGVPNFLKHANSDPNGMLAAHTPDTAHLTLALAILLWNAKQHLKSSKRLLGATVPPARWQSSLVRAWVGSLQPMMTTASATVAAAIVCCITHPPLEQ